MRKVYEDQDMTMVGYYQNILEGQGIRTLVKNEYASLATGEIPFTQVYPELWVSDPSNYESSVALIRSLRDEHTAEAKDDSKQSTEGPDQWKAVRWIAKLVVVLFLIYLLVYFSQDLVK